MQAHATSVECHTRKIQGGGEHGCMVKQPATVALVFYGVGINDASGNVARTLVAVSGRRSLHIEGSSQSWKVS